MHKRMLIFQSSIRHMHRLCDVFEALVYRMAPSKAVVAVASVILALSVGLVFAVRSYFDAETARKSEQGGNS